VGAESQTLGGVWPFDLEAQIRNRGIEIKMTEKKLKQALAPTRRWNIQ
jgi:hypothetical protein